MLKLTLFTFFAVISGAFGSLLITCNQEKINGNEETIAGGSQKVPINTDIRMAALNCTSLWNQEQSSSSSFFKIICLKSAQKQIVAGVKYILGVKFAETTCEKAKMPSNGLLTQSNVDACAIKTDGSFYECNLEYWVQSWSNIYKLTMANCSTITSI